HREWYTCSMATFDTVEIGFTLFDTAIGRCGIAWGPRGIVGVQLPEGQEARTRAWIRRRFPRAREAAPPAAVQEAVDGIVALLAGEPSDLAAVALDMTEVPPFNRSVYDLARTLPPGQTVTYGEIAARLGDKRQLRASAGDVRAGAGRPRSRAHPADRRRRSARGRPLAPEAAGGAGPGAQDRRRRDPNARREPHADRRGAPGAADGRARHRPL